MTWAFILAQTLMHGDREHLGVWLANKEHYHFIKVGQGKQM